MAIPGCDHNFLHVVKVENPFILQIFDLMKTIVNTAFQRVEIKKTSQ